MPEERKKALECYECTNVSAPYATVADGDECPACESAETHVVVLEGCAIGKSCTHDDHHFGLGLHVVDEED